MYHSLSTVYNLASLEMANSQAGGMKGYWKCALAVFLVSMSPFQYGVDFGLIGGVQAMVGFLEVCLLMSLILQ